MNNRLLLLSLALILGCGVAAADHRYTPLGPAYSDAERIAQEHRIDRIRENEVCSKHPNSYLCEFWRERYDVQRSRKTAYPR